jgi:hypothetical protein
MKKHCVGTATDTDFFLVDLKKLLALPKVPNVVNEKFCRRTG